jgi:hypothetical protein
MPGSTVHSICDSLRVAAPYATLFQAAHLLGKEMRLRGLQVVIAQLAVQGVSGWEQ